MLFDPEKFEPLTETAWDEDRAQEGIREIVADADEAYDDEGLWPADEWDAWQTPTPLKNLYVGAAGVLWALDVLRRRGYGEPRLDLARAAQRTLEVWRERPEILTTLELPEPASAALMMSGGGILVVRWRLSPSRAVADELLELVRANANNEAIEVMWGAPGTMLAARAMLDWTGEERWAEVWRESATAVLARREDDGLWTKRLYGGTSRGLGPPHGVVGNVLALFGGHELLADETRRTLAETTDAVLQRNAVIEEGGVNWPNRDGDALEQDGELKLQWCTGSPGIVASAGLYLDEELALAGGETIWQAGPHGPEKGACICHGTAGNGYAFLKLFERTQDERWLDRARRFAMHALEQAGRARDERGRGRYSLWTGDVGVAVYAADCLDATTRYPILETWD